MLYAIPCFGYTLGFCYCFSPSNLTHGVAEWLMLLLMQVLLIPLYAAFEAYGIVLALIAPWKKFAPMLKKFATEWFGGKKKRPSAQGETAFTGFKLVQKQGNLRSFGVVRWMGCIFLPCLGLGPVGPDQSSAPLTRKYMPCSEVPSDALALAT